MAGGRFMVRTYVSGEVTERSMFPVGNAAKVRKPQVKGATPPRKQDQNDRSAVKRLARLINCNFYHGCLWITLTYSAAMFEALVTGLIRAGMPLTDDAVREAAVRERDNCLRRVKYDLKKSGAELKYIAVTSDYDGDTGKPVRVHHHILAPKLAFDAFVKHWGVDSVDIRPLRDQKDYTPVAVYLMKQVRRQPDLRKYSASRNLAKPVITEEIVLESSELKAPRGAVVQERVFDADSATQYLRFVNPPPRASGRRAGVSSG